MKPFDRNKAAQYFVVAWVKGWRMYTYLTAIQAQDLDYEKRHALYPWLPNKDQFHMYKKNAAIRPWIAVSMKAINDKLYDAKDNKERLELAKHIEKWDATGVIIGSSHREALNERLKAKRQIRQRGLEHKLSVDLMRRASGHHWNVIK